jgi:hypothetical protein
MKLIVFGATGGTGRQVVAPAFSAGHTVTAVGRRPDAPAIPREQLTTVCGMYSILPRWRSRWPGKTRRSRRWGSAVARPPASSRRWSTTSCRR